MTETDGRLARGEASRAVMLEAASQIIATEGIQALTHRAVATQIRVSHALVVYHFASVTELRQATLLEAGRRIVDRLAELLGANADPAQVPALAAKLAVEMVTSLRNQTVTLFALMAQATRDEGLRPAVEQVTVRIADLIEPLSGYRKLANNAASALLGLVLAAMAEGHDKQLETFRDQVIDLVEHFDPHRNAD